MSESHAQDTHHDDHHDHHPTGLLRYLYSTNHKDIGTMYIIYGFVFGLVGFVMSMLIRIELAHPGAGILGGDHQLYNVLITSHGLIMIFFMIMPVFIGGFGNWFMPMMIGAPDMAFPRMNNISFWLLVPAGMLVRDVRLVDGGTGVAGRFMHRCRLRYPGPGGGLPILALHLAGASSISGRDQLHHDHLQHACAGHDPAPRCRCLPGLCW